MFDKSTLNRLIIFGLVGFIGMIIDYGITAFFKEILALNKYLSNTVGFISAATSNYYFEPTENKNKHRVDVEYLNFGTTEISSTPKGIIKDSRWCVCTFRNSGTLTKIKMKHIGYKPHIDDIVKQRSNRRKPHKS